MTPDDPRHGSYTTYRKQGCRCFPCRLAYHQYRAELRADRANNRPRIVDAQPAREHFYNWKEATGCGLRVFANIAGIGARTMTDLVCSGRQRARAVTVEKILAVPIPSAGRLPDIDEVPALGVERRVQALARLGWTRADMSLHAGHPRYWINNLIGHDFVTRANFQAVAKMYDELSMRQGPSSRVRVRAERKGWAPPLAWDNIDDPDEVPQGVATVAQTEERVRTWDSREHHACRRCGVVREVRHGRDNLCADCLGVDAISPRRLRPRHVTPVCGTESAYQRHAHSGDTATDDRRVTCAPCLTAHAAHVANKRAGAA